MIKNLSVRNRFKALALSALMVVSAGAFTACSKKDNNDNTSIVETELRSFSDVIDFLPEGRKRDNLSVVYNALEKLNGEVSKSVRVSTDGEHAFRTDWNTMQALVLAANDFTSKEMLDMFDGYEYNVNHLYEKYKNFCTLFIPFGERLKMETGLADLIIDSNEKANFLKYENILIEINKAREINDNDKLNSLYNTAFSYIREDFINKNSTAFSNEVVDNNSITGYNALVIPYVNTIIELGRNSHYKLSNDEMKKLNEYGICNSALKSIEDNLEGYEIAVNSVEEIEYLEMYEIARDYAIRELTEKGIYYVSDEMSILDIINGEKLVYNKIETTSVYANKVGGTKTTKKTDTRKYDNIDDLKKHENKDVVKQAEEGKKKVDEDISKENDKAREEAQQEANDKAQQESNNNKQESDKEMKEIEDNAKVVDDKGNEDKDATIVQPKDPSTVIGGVVTTRPYDGDTYDSNGNVVVKQNSSRNVKIEEEPTTEIETTKVYTKTR